MGTSISFWTHGYMPVQLLLLVAGVFFLFVAGQAVLTRYGRPVPPFWQAVLMWAVAYGLFKWAIRPALPSSLLYTYMGVIMVAIFCLVSATEESWAQCRSTVTTFLTNESGWYRAGRAIAFTIAPLIAMVGTYKAVVPSFEEPAELRINHPAPPRTITVHGVKVDLQTATNPFRVGEGLRGPAATDAPSPAS